MNLHLIVKKNPFAVRLSTTILKKAIFFFTNKKPVSKFSKKHTIHTFFSRPIFFLKKRTSFSPSINLPFDNFLKEKYFTNYTVFGQQFFSLDNTYKLHFTITFTKRNFFISVGSNIKWRFFIKPEKLYSEVDTTSTTQEEPIIYYNPDEVTEVEFIEKKPPVMLVDYSDPLLNSDLLYSDYSVRRMYVNATVSAGSTHLEDKSKRLRFSNYAVGRDLAVLIVSIFWTSIHKLELPLFSISIKFKGRIKWARSIISYVWKSINKLYWEHQSYVLRHRNVAFKKEDGDQTNSDLVKYEHSLSRLKMIEECPLFFELLSSIKSIPHNGCKMKKISRLRRNR